MTEQKRHMLRLLALTAACTLYITACTPQMSPEEIAVTYVAATEQFTTAVAQAVTTAVAATFTAVPTNTATATYTPTPRPSATPTETPTITPSFTPTIVVTPTETHTPVPTVTNTPDAATIKANQLYSSLRNLKQYAELLYSGLGGSGTGRVSCSKELNDSIVVNLDKVRALPTFDDTLLSSRAIGARINYDAAKSNILDSQELLDAYNNCSSWLAAGKPAEGVRFASDSVLVALSAIQRAITLADSGINN